MYHSFLTVISIFYRRIQVLSGLDPITSCKLQLGAFACKMKKLYMYHWVNIRGKIMISGQRFVHSRHNKGELLLLFFFLYSFFIQYIPTVASPPSTSPSPSLHLPSLPDPVPLCFPLEKGQASQGYQPNTA